jgi:hypothetical protein
MVVREKSTRRRNVVDSKRSSRLGDRYTTTRDARRPMVTRVSSASPVLLSGHSSRSPSPMLTRSCSVPRLELVDEFVARVEPQTPPPQQQSSASLLSQSSLCPICLEPILPGQDVMTLGCRSQRPSSTPHQIHVGRCAHEWLAAANARSGIQCPICRDLRSQELAAMAPGGAYRLHGAVRLLMWPHVMDVDSDREDDE